MKRLFVVLLMSLTLLMTAVPAARADHTRSCREVTVHFRPAVCTDQHDGYRWVWVCPDGYWNWCILVLGPMN